MSTKPTSSQPESGDQTPLPSVDLDSDTFFSPLPTLHHNPQSTLTDKPTPLARASSIRVTISNRRSQPPSPVQPKGTTKVVSERNPHVPAEIVIDTTTSETEYPRYTESDIVVISGGSGYNQLVNATPSATYIMPISDNGGSSSEIIRVLSGPSVGDLRSRLVRLIPLPSEDPNQPTPAPQLPATQECTCSSCGTTNMVPAPRAIVPSSNGALYRLLSYRLPVSGRSSAVKAEWRSILEGSHKLWRGIEHERREAVRGFLVLFDTEILRRSNRKFNFRGGSIGNFFIAAAQKFFRSIQSAIFLFSAITLINGAGVATGLTFGPFANGGTYSAIGAGTGSRVIPAINTNHTATIAADLRDGETIVGQCEISHPANPSPEPASQGLIAAAAAQHAARYGAFTPSLRARALLGGSLVGTPAGPTHGTPPTQNHPLSHSVHPHSLANSMIFDPSQPGSGMHTPLPHAVGSLTGDGLEIQPHGPDGNHADDQETDGSDNSDPRSDDEGGHDTETDPLYATAPPNPASFSTSSHPLSQSTTAQQEDTTLTATPPSRKKDKSTPSNLVFSKDGQDEPRLSAPIDRVYYVNAYRNEISPAPNPGYLAALGQASTLVYSCGSLWTSIVPCIALRGIATAIAKSPTLKRKILLLNSAWDRETDGMTAHDFVHAIVDSLNSSDIDAGLLGQGVIGSLGSGVVPPSLYQADPSSPSATSSGATMAPGTENSTTHSWSASSTADPAVEHTWNAFSGKGYKPRDLINWVVYLEHSQVPMEAYDLTSQTGIRTVRIRVPKPADGRPPKFSEKAICLALAVIRAEEEKEQLEADSLGMASVQL